MDHHRKRIAIVVQRYGPEVLGGSESLARSLAHLLADIYDIEVLTTCAKDYVTWKNEFPAGESMDGPVKVRRFIVDRPRSRWFNIYNALMLKVPHTRWMEEAWMRMQGPYSSDMIRHINSDPDRYHAFIFMTYMYGTTYYGSCKVIGRSILVPTAHDEPYIRFGIYRNMFARAWSVICLTDEEKILVEGLFGLRGRCSVIGAPVGECSGDPQKALNKHGINGPFLTYIGRIDVMKGVDTMIDYFNRYISEHGPDLSLVLCGTGPLEVPQSKNIHYIGFVPEEDKYGIIRAALATVIPSRFESYSIAAIESMKCGTPVIVNNECATLKGHCDRGGGGLAYSSYDEFRDSVNRIRDEPGLRGRMAQSGISYVHENYSMETLGKKYISLLDGLTTKK